MLAWFLSDLIPISKHEMLMTRLAVGARGNLVDYGRGVRPTTALNLAMLPIAVRRGSPGGTTMPHNAEYSGNRTVDGLGLPTNLLLFSQL
jgi:hypothetical protein